MFRLSTTLRNPVRIMLVLAVLIVAAGIIIDRDTNEVTFQTAVGQTNDTLQTSEDFLHLERANRAFIDLVARTRPAVVQIKTKTQRNRITIQRQQRSPEDNENNEEQFRRFFDDESPFRFFFDERPPRPLNPNLPPVHGIGSGVIVSDDGYILTNNHVIERSDEITVILSNGKEYAAELVGRDAAGTEVSGTDLALIKIDAEELPTLAFGDSDQLEVGEWVIAIGTPLNFSQTVTRGIVSAKGRFGHFGIQYGNFIQTDAPINKGNSGGALVNIRGELVGINTAIVTGGLSTGNIGIGFAVPSKMAQQVLPQLIKHGKVERGWLGIGMKSVDTALAEKLNFDTLRGAYVSGVSKDSPADKGGIQPEDVIVEFNDETIRDINHLMHVVAATEVGKSVKVIVIRGNNKEKQLTVKLGKRTEEVIAKLNAQLEETARAEMRPEGTRVERDEQKEAFAGLHVQNLTPAIAERYGYSPDEKGVVVTQVESGSNAEKKGIVPGSLIQEMEWTSVDDLKSYSRLVEQLTNENKKQVLLYVKSPNGQGGAYVTIKVSTSDE